MENKKHYYNCAYMRRERLQAYIDQINAVARWSEAKDSILEVGKGNGYLSHVLSAYYSMRIKSVDIDPNLQPDFIADISSPEFVLPETYDVALCFEVLEHIPWEKIATVIDNLLGQVRHDLIISVPDANFFFQLKLNIFWLLFTPLNLTLSFPRILRNRTTLGSGHHWEIGIKNNGKPVTKKQLIHDVLGVENLVEEYRGREFAGHHFFILRGKAAT
ncbi:MAG: methyltransferase domain-containing protein [Calditrichia bacterium]